MSTPSQDDALSTAVRHRVSTWQARAERVAGGEEPDAYRGPDSLPAFADPAVCLRARRMREVLEQPARRQALVDFVDAVLVPLSAAQGAAAHADAHAQLLAAGVDLKVLADAHRGLRRPPADLDRPRAGIGGLLAGLTDRVEAATSRVAPHRTIARATLQLRVLFGTPADILMVELDDDVDDLRDAGLGADVELLGIPVVGPEGADQFVTQLRHELFRRDDLRSVTVAAADLAPELLGRVVWATALTPGPAARAHFAERLRPVLRASRESEIDLVLRAPRGGESLVLDVILELALEPEFAYVTPYLAVDESALRADPTIVERLLSAADVRRSNGGRPLGLRVARTAATQDDEMQELLDGLVVPETSALLHLDIASDRLEDHAIAAELARARTGATAPRAHVSALCPREEAWTLGQDVALSVSLLAIPSPPAQDDPAETATLVATATARAVHRLAALAAERSGAAHGVPRTSGRLSGAAPVFLAASAVPEHPEGAEQAAESVDVAADALHALTVEELRELARGARVAGEAWGTVPARSRADALDSAAHALTDRGLREAGDVLRTFAEGARALAELGDGASFESDRLAVAVPDPGRPDEAVASAAAGALAAGSAVLVLVPRAAAPRARRVAEVLREALAAHGAPAGLLRVLPTDEESSALLDLDEIDTVVAADPVLAREVEARRAAGPAGTRVLTGPAGPSAMMITGAAQAELAAADLVASAFAGGGELPGSTSVGHLIGAAAGSQRLRSAILDAVAALPPMPAAAHERPEVVRARSLDAGEEWLVEPRRIGGEGAWTPGIKTGVAAGGHMASVRIGGPVLGLLSCATLEDALRIAQAARGLVVACWTTDAREWRTVTETADAPHLVLRRPAVGGVAPARGAAAAAGAAGWDDGVALGADVPARLGQWFEDALPTRRDEPSDPVRAALTDYTGLILEQADRSWLRAAVASDAHAWARSLVRVVDTAQDGPNSVLLRRHGVATAWIRAGEGTAVVELVRVLAAAHTVGATVRLSLAPSISSALKEMDTLGEPARQGLRRLTPLVDRVEDVSSFAARIRSGTISGRIRVLGQEAEVMPGMVAGRGVELSTEPVLAQGELELSRLLRSQTMTQPRPDLPEL